MVGEPGKTRRSGSKLDRFRFHKDMAKNGFSSRVVDELNKFGSHVVSANTVGILKSIDKLVDVDVRST